MKGWTEQPETMLGAGGDLSHYLPDHHMQLGSVLGRAQQYLSQIKPNTEPLGPLDNEKPISKMDQAKYDRALNLVNKPLSVLKNIHQGNLTTDDMAVMEGVYPKLHKDLQQKFMNGIMAQRQKGLTIPYKQKLAMSTYLGMNLDSTIGPSTMMSLMQGQKGQGGGQPGAGGNPGGAKKPPQSAYSKMKEGTDSNMTMTQRAEQDRITPQ